MVKITKKNSLIILEGDEYLSSAIDRRPKFHLYKPHIAVIVVFLGITLMYFHHLKTI